jgi:hypothetical protein
LRLLLLLWLWLLRLLRPPSRAASGHCSEGKATVRLLEARLRSAEGTRLLPLCERCGCGCGCC